MRGKELREGPYLSVDTRFSRSTRAGSAERKAGVLIPEQFPHGGDTKSRSHDVTLKDVGISRMQSVRWQLEAKVPENQVSEQI